MAPTSPCARRFGTPQTVQTLGNAYLDIASRLDALVQELRQGVNSVVPNDWRGPNATTFKKHAEEELTAATQQAAEARKVGQAALTLAARLDACLVLEEQAEAIARTGGYFVNAGCDLEPIPGSTNTPESGAAAQAAYLMLTEAQSEAIGARQVFFNAVATYQQQVQQRIKILLPLAVGFGRAPTGIGPARPGRMAPPQPKAGAVGPDPATSIIRPVTDPIPKSVSDRITPREAVDTNGFRPSQSQLDKLGITNQRMEWWASGRAPVGMTPDQYTTMKSSMFESLGKDGITDKVDVRLHGSGANFFSSDSKPWKTPAQLANDPVAQKLAEDFSGDNPPPAHQMFDSRYRLGQAGPYNEADVLKYPSDYDLNFSSDQMMQKAQAQYDARAAAGEPYKGDMLTARGYLNNEDGLVDDTFPELKNWRNQWSEQTGRDVNYAVFPSSGPGDTTNVGMGVSVHFKPTDWMIEP
jgi:hypothetical protein